MSVYGRRMEFREFDTVRIQRPSLDRGDLTEEPAAFKGDFDLESIRIGHGDQTGVHGEGSLSHAVVTGVGLSGARLSPLMLSDVAFDDVDMSNAALPDTTARRVEFVNCRGIGLQFAMKQATDFYAEQCRFDYATIRIDKVKNAAVFSECSFRETVFVGDLSNVIFSDCDLNATEFEVSRAADCDLRSSRLTDVRGLLTLRGAKITTEQAVSVARIIATESGLSVDD